MKQTKEKTFWKFKELSLLCNDWIKEETETQCEEYIKDNYSKSTIYQNLTFEFSQL